MFKELRSELLKKSDAKLKGNLGELAKRIEVLRGKSAKDFNNVADDVKCFRPPVENYDWYTVHDDDDKKEKR